MAVSRTKSNGYDIKGVGKLIEVTSDGFLFRDPKAGDSKITLQEITELIGKEVTFSFKISDKELV
ncbi:hypothetical protein G9F71_008350 [Clostridium sp. FP2]|uniref:hypothetical protein n=1 Tax=Clostridium sp. FP2 TaxID=2724481 RepID=UPI0013E98E78|nr:hypothetical protein [Clostridium sp. FP2]MBZ9622862.1 hypothetical protein [Clostridium sp. FP2]